MNIVLIQMKLKFGVKKLNTGKKKSYTYVQILNEIRNDEGV